MLASEFKHMSDKLHERGHKLVIIHQNLVDLVWQNRPQPKLKPLETLDLRYSGLYIQKYVIKILRYEIRYPLKFYKACGIKKTRKEKK